MEVIIETPTLNAYKNELIKAGFSEVIAQVSKKINNSGLDSTTRIILAHEPLYIYLLHKTIIEEGVKDSEGVYNRVISHSESLRQTLYEKVIDAVIQKNHKTPPSASEKEDLLEKILELNPPLDKSEKYVLEELEEITQKGNIPDIVNEYLKKYPEVFFNFKLKQPVQEAMVARLMETGFKVEAGLTIPQAVEKYNDILFYAYSFALRAAGDGEDPIRNIFSSNGHLTWDYNVDYFDSIEEQGVERENIMAAGALYYIYSLGDMLGIYRITDAILLAWSHGRLDIPQGPATNKLYRYYKLREERSTQAERQMFYRQVLNLGDAQVLDKMTVNGDFTQIWDNLMNQVVDYIQKYETKETNFTNVSKLGVYQAIKDLQYNLSVACSGMVKAIIPEMYAHLQSAIEILKEQAVVDQLGYGFNKSMWKVIERVSQSEFGILPNVSAMRVSAIEGHKIFKFVADFDQGTITDDEFNLQFIPACESFIISQSQLGGYQPSNTNMVEEPKEMMEDEWDF